MGDADRDASRQPWACCPRGRCESRSSMSRRTGDAYGPFTLDAFTVSGNAVIYVVQQSQLLKGARAGSAVHRAMLAAVLWHEMAHVSGADERRARQAEEELWIRFVRDGRVDTVIGLRYLQALQRRVGDQTVRLPGPIELADRFGRKCREWNWAAGPEFGSATGHRNGTASHVLDRARLGTFRPDAPQRRHTCRTN